MSETETNTNRATYCPEDNKLRLYVGRVPRDEYEALRADGWTSTPKQACDFVATWTPSRRDTALEYAGIIEDEDQSPAERAADRAERFAGYRDKRATEAGGLADRYDAGPSAIGYQSQAKAERAVARFDRVAAKAVDSWGKAEYWQARTVGVISHALHVCSPSVRMGRIKELEADLRRQTPGGEWHTHTSLRLAYERQMLEAQGGRAGVLEMVPGGRLHGKLIAKVNKSSVSGRVVSVDVVGPAVSGWAYKVRNVPGTAFALYNFETERMAPGAYSAPDDASLAELEEFKRAKDSGKPKLDTVPLVNPTDSDAQRLQDLWNQKALGELQARDKRNGGDWYARQYKPSEVLRITQAEYSAASKGTYARAGTRNVFRGGIEETATYFGNQKMREKYGREVCSVRRTWGGEYSGSRVIVLTDKPQKPLPSEVWEPATETVNA